MGVSRLSYTFARPLGSLCIATSSSYAFFLPVFFSSPEVLSLISSTPSVDRFRIAGLETGAGYIGWLGRTEDAASESLVVKQMRMLGAVPFCKTNMPMSMMLGDTSNNITGSTLNPAARHLSSGGAAGGEFSRPLVQFNVSDGSLKVRELFSL